MTAPPSAALGREDRVRALPTDELYQRRKRHAAGASAGGALRHRPGGL